MPISREEWEDGSEHHTEVDDILRFLENSDVAHSIDEIA